MNEFYATEEETGFSGGVIMSGVTKVNREPIVEHVEHMIVRVEKTTDVLRERLQTVVVPESPMAETVARLQAPPSSHLRGQLERLSEALGGIDSILRQIDL